MHNIYCMHGSNVIHGFVSLSLHTLTSLRFFSHLLQLSWLLAPPLTSLMIIQIFFLHWVVWMCRMTLSAHSSSQQVERPKVAVCLSGQVGRLIPDYFEEGLFRANPSFHFHLFFNLAHSKVLYTTFNVIQDTKYQNMTTAQISLAMHYMFDEVPNVKIAKMSFDRLLTRHEWVQKTGMKKFNLFNQFSKSGYVMLNMYKHHEDCAQQIESYEKVNSIEMDYVINTREDIFFFKPLDLSSLISSYMTTGSRGCDLLTKGCLDFGGVNMRLQFLKRRPSGTKYMEKVSYFQQMLQLHNSRTFENPEMFEQYIAEKVLGMKVCKLDVEEFGVTAARLSYVNLSICFIHQELKLFEPKSSPPCVPQSQMDFAIMHLCPRVKTRFEFIPWQNFTFVPNSAFPKPTKSYHRKFQGDLNSKSTLLRN